MTDELPDLAQPASQASALSTQETLAAIDEFLAKREELIRELEGMLPNFTTFDLLGWISLRNSLIDPERYREGETGGMALRVEYLALLSLINGVQFSPS